MQQHGYELSQIHPANKQIHWSHNKPLFPANICRNTDTNYHKFIPQTSKFIDHTTNRYPVYLHVHSRTSQPTHYMHTLYRCTNRCTVTSRSPIATTTKTKTERLEYLTFTCQIQPFYLIQTWFRRKPPTVTGPFLSNMKEDINTPVMNVSWLFIQALVFLRSPSWLNHLWNAFLYQNYGTLTWLP